MIRPLLLFSDFLITSLRDTGHCSEEKLDEGESMAKFNGKLMARFRSLSHRCNQRVVGKGPWAEIAPLRSVEKVRAGIAIASLNKLTV